MILAADFAETFSLRSTDFTAPLKPGWVFDLAIDVAFLGTDGTLLPINQSAYMLISETRTGKLKGSGA